MHESGALGTAIDKAIHDWPADGTGGQLELEIRDATRADAGSVAFHTAAILADRGFSMTTFTVVTHDVRCAVCGEVAEAPSRADPECAGCDAPLPRVPGPAVVCREVSPCA